MSRLSRWSAIAAVVFLSFGTVSLGVAGPASAAVPVSVPAADPVVPGPGGLTGAKQYMLNVTGKVLGSAMPTAWKREQISLNNRFNASWENLARTTGIPSGVPEGQLITEGYLTTPQTMADYRLRNSQMALTGGTNGAPMRAPATAAKTFAKAVGGAFTAYTGFEVGTMLGNAVPSSWYGVDDKTSVVCSQTGTDFVGGLMRNISGVDCSGWSVDAGYPKNQDAAQGYSMGKVCRADGNLCVEVVSMDQAPGNNLFCAKFTGSAQAADGTVSSGSEQFDTTWTKGPRVNMYTSASSSTAYCQGTMPAGATGSRYFRAGASDDFLTGVRPGGSAASVPFTPVTKTAGDPPRTLSCSILGSDGATYTQDGAPYKESSGTVSPPQCPVLPDGVTAQNISIDQKADPANKVPATNVANQPTTTDYQNWHSSYPECATGACKLDLLKKPGLSSCFDDSASCVSWFDDAAKVNDYQCRYGVHDVDLTECNVYSGVFKPERVAVGAPYSDPVSGVWSGGQSAPNPTDAAAGKAMGTPIQSPITSRGCDGITVTGFDPVGFVMRPVQCAMEWAFVPRPAVVSTEFAKTSIAWAATPPGKLGAIVGGIVVAPNVSGCSGIPFRMQGKDMNFLDACPGSALAPVAQWSTTISGLLFVVGGAFAIISMISSVIGYRGLTVAGGNH